MVISPHHAVMCADYFRIAGKESQGETFGQFMARSQRKSRMAEAFVRELDRLCRRMILHGTEGRGKKSWTVDAGHCIYPSALQGLQAGADRRIGLSFARITGQAVHCHNGRKSGTWGIRVASGDLSLAERTGPYGCSVQGRV